MLEQETTPAVITVIRKLAAGSESTALINEALPKLNLGHPDTRAHLLDVAEHWLRAGIDGWRLDVAEEIGGDFWEEFRARCRAVSPDAYLVAEVWHAKPEWLTGRGCARVVIGCCTLVIGGVTQAVSNAADISMVS